MSLFESHNNKVSGPHFNGPEYVPQRDHARLTGQLKRVFDLMCDSRWRTLNDIADKTGDPHASISAQLRHLRKTRFGSHTVNRRAKNGNSSGLFEYQLVVNKETTNTRFSSTSSASTKTKTCKNRPRTAGEPNKQPAD